MPPPRAAAGGTSPASSIGRGFPSSGAEGAFAEVRRDDGEVIGVGGDSTGSTKVEDEVIVMN